MTFKQPASLNRFVVEPLPLTWGFRWKLIRIYLPLLAFITICLAETVSLGLWKRDQLEITSLGLVFVVPAFMLTLIFISNEIRLRGSQGAGRLLNVLEKGISFQVAGGRIIRWPKVVAFWFENIPGEPQFSKVTMEYFGDRKTKLPRRESLALEKQNQCPALISELKLLQQQHNLNFRIELDRPLPPRPMPRNPVLGMSLYLAGVLFLMHGMPLLLISLTHDSGKSNQSDSSDRWSPKQKEKFAKFLNAHFSSKAEFKQFILVSGGVLTTIGVALLICGTVIQRKKTNENFKPQLKLAT